MSEAARLLEAAQFAAHKHRDQRRKGRAASPYINHPIAVAEILARHGIDDIVTLQAALLHDTIEDTETTPAELEAAFGGAVAHVVGEVTDDKALDRATRKRLQIEHAPGLSARAKLIKIADKICNVTDVTSDPPPDWPLERRVEYLTWTEQVVAGCRGTHDTLERHYDELLATGRRQLLAGT